MFNQQLPLPLEPPPDAARDHTRSSEHDFKQRLAEISTGRIVGITLTRNRSTILSAKPIEAKTPAGSPPGQQVNIRIHRCFVEAPEPVLQAAADFASKRLTKLRRRQALDVLRDYFDQHAPKEPEQRRQPRPLRGPRGQHHDLSELFDTINRDYFEGELDLTISWGTPPARRAKRRRTIQLGSFHDETQTIRIHPVLDDKRVPRFVIGSVLHHEMVHAVVPAQRSPGSRRRRVHTPEFRRREQEFKQLAQAEAWLGKHLFRLMGQLERELKRKS